jgi:DNA-binding transcriptional MerR regulator
MYRASDYQRLLDRARKAGLSAREINSAMSGQPAGEDRTQADANGFVWMIDARGHRTLTPPAESTVE